MGPAKGKPLTQSSEAPQGGAEATGEVIFLAVPAPLYRQLSDEAAKRQLTLAQFLAGAVSEAVQKPIPAPPQYLTEG